MSFQLLIPSDRTQPLGKGCGVLWGPADGPHCRSPEGTLLCWKCPVATGDTVSPHVHASVQVPVWPPPVQCWADLYLGGRKGRCLMMLAQPSPLALGNASGPESHRSLCSSLEPFWEGRR